MDETLFLICEELKSNRFFGVLAGLGLGDCVYQPYLGTLILSSVGLHEVTDDLFVFYSDLMDRESSLLAEDMASLTSQALRIHHILLSEKLKRQP